MSFSSCYPAGLFAGIVLVLSCCVAGEPYVTTVRDSVPRTESEIEFAKSILNEAQRQSIAENKEVCGYIGIDEQGQYVVSKTSVGSRSSCLARDIDEDFQAIASFHTHGAYSVNYDSEIPSADDMLTDFDEGLDGYIATPGDRLWLVDLKSETARQICGAGCLLSDPAFESDVKLVPKTVSLDDLE